MFSKILKPFDTKLYVPSEGSMDSHALFLIMHHLMHIS